MRPAYIYGLFDPLRPDEIRYVGKTTGPVRRLKAHAAQRGSDYKSRWVASLLKEDRSPQMRILAEVDVQADWQEVERYWIKKLRVAGHRLTNLTEGGTGFAAGDLNPNKSVEARQRARKRMLGNEYGVGHTGSELQRQQVIEYNATRAITDEMREKWRLAATGNTYRKGKHGPLWSPARKKKQSMALKGKAKSSEHREHIAAAQRRAWARRRGDI